MNGRPRFLIVDCHSVIFAWPELLALHRQKTATARDLLVKLLTEYQDYTGIKVVAVFDGGRSSQFSEETEPGGIQVFYSAAGQTADTIIERLVAKYAERCDITVATFDRMEQQTIHAFGATWVSAQELRPLMDEASRDFARRLKDFRKDNERR